MEKVKADPERLAKFRDGRNRYQKQKRESDPVYAARKRARQRRHYRENADQYKANVSKRKARKLGSGGSHSAEAWRQMLELFGNRCLCCGRTERITKDHIVPITRGGTDDIQNIQPLCIWCNKSKFTCGNDYRTQEKVVLPELNAVGKLIFKGRVGKEELERLTKHKPVSRFTGVSYAPKNAQSRKIWRARIQIDGKLISLGRYETEREAAQAYNAAAQRYERAFVNDVKDSESESPLALQANSE